MNLSGRKGTPCLSKACLTILILTVAVCPSVGLCADGQGAEKEIGLFVHQSKTIRAPWPVVRVSVTDPKIADVQMLTAQEILLQGKAVGSTDLIMWSKKEQISQARIDVDVDLRRIKAELLKLFPHSKLEISQAQDMMVVKGQLARAEHAAQLRSFLGSSGVKYIDMTSVAGVQQVMLQVRFAEVSRVALRMLGINGFITGSDAFGASTIGSSGGGPINPISIGVPSGAAASTSGGVPFQFTSDVGVSSSVTLFAGFPEIGLELFLSALSENQYLRVLAEPNLIALSGHEASFLAGGEYPIPIVQGSTAGAGSTITVEYREFGVRLGFLPTVLGDGVIRLHVSPEVSELSDVGAVIIEGFQIPSVTTRRAETTLELHSGQTFAMAGLLRKTSGATNSRVPGLGDMPILGALFRSIRYEREETELVVMVTASLVEPMNLADEPPLVGFAHVCPDDWELYALGQTSGQAPARLSSSQASWLQRRGLDRLKGPGSWVTYEGEPARSRATLARVDSQAHQQSERPAEEPCPQ